MEAAVPLVVFTVVYLGTDAIGASVLVALGSAVIAYAVRVAQGTDTRFVRNGLFGIIVAAALAAVTGQAQAAFLPGIVQSAAWAVVLAASIALRRPVLGYVVGAVLDDPTGWRRDPAVVRLGDRLTVVLLVPMVVRVAVQYPLYLAGEVGWLGVSRLALGWPLHAAALAAAGMVLLRGETPLHSDADDGGPRG